MWEKMAVDLLVRALTNDGLYGGHSANWKNCNGCNGGHTLPRGRRWLLISWLERSQMMSCHRCMEDTLPIGKKWRVIC
jgi:hypothetical protein